MNEPKSLDSLFTEKIFRIPDYQRGYAWQTSQLKYFWEDLINLSDNRSHYTGVLTLKEVGSEKISDSDNKYWLVENHSYKMYHIVDGQQRLATFVIFLQAFIDFIRELEVNNGKLDKEIYITDSLSLEAVISRYLFKIKPTGNQYRTYKFGYTVDNPSYKYLRYKIFNEDISLSIEETLYTLNLRDAKNYFDEQLKELYSKAGLSRLQDIYKKLTKRFLFNEYVIKGEINVFVAFETMNNRGKSLSKLELLKNRLIYLTTLYTDEELDPADRRDLRETINYAWQEVYSQLGRNAKHPLNDDDFLTAHCIMYYCRKKEGNYINFLLDEKFTPQQIHKKKEYENGDTEEKVTKTGPLLQPTEIIDYVNSLKASATHWFNLHYPYLATELSDKEKEALDRLNRIGIKYFRPLVMSVLKNEINQDKSSDKRIELLDHIERFIFIVFLLCQVRSNSWDSKFYEASHELNNNKGKTTLKDIKDRLNAAVSHYFYDDGTLNNWYFYVYLEKKFNRDKKNGYYGWNALRYFLYEYEMDLLSQSRQKKVTWEDLLKSSNDKISIEHIFPQTLTGNWKVVFADVAEKNHHIYSGSIGNLLLLSMSINSSLQNKNFDDKKNPKRNDAGDKVRNGYSDGSHSEIEVSRHKEWSPASIKDRGLILLSFMEERWNFKFKNDQEKEDLLFLNTIED